ncbi:MAG: ABC transporter ATP-binding protein [Candidatus Pacebacteria bacterium]|nr:ABC transporter ATP-binding protein [Candidatus Paceibacterota bacterium]
MNTFTKQPLVSLRGISKSFYLQGGQEVPVLYDIDLDIFEGDMVAILGPSGSGKSTLMNIIGGLDIATKGSYRFTDKEVEKLSSDELAELRSTDISFIFQSFHLLPGKTVYQNVMLPLLYQRTFTGDHDESVRRALARAALEETHWHKKPNQLSGGQRQRVAIARALVATPKLLLADEPTGNLDSKTGDNIIDALTELNEQHGTTIVIVTHDQSLTEVVHRVINIMDGRVTETNGNKL